MSTRGAVNRRCVLILCSVVAGTACDLVAESGQTLELGGDGTVFGTGGNAQTRPNSAVTVNPGGTVVVRNASALGGGLLVQQAGQQRFGRAGAGISAMGGGGTVRVEQGLVAGGSVVLQVALPGNAFDLPGAAIDVINSSVEISGGTIRGGAVVSQVGPFLPATVPPDGDADPFFRPGISIAGGTLRVTGGTVTAGIIDPPDPDALGRSGLVDRAQSEIRGGTFSDILEIRDGRARVFGGTFDFLLFNNFDPNSCSEIRGGQPNTIVVSVGRVIVAGSGLTLTPVDVGDDSPFAASVLTGTLENGQTVEAIVLLDLVFGGDVQLVAAGGPGCP